MQWLDKIKGSSLIEVLIASSIFSLFVLQAIAHSLGSYRTVRTCLENTKNVIAEESHYRSQRKHAQGMTLIELMIGLAMTMILTLGFIQAFSIINKIYIRHESLTQIQENARSIHYILREVYTRQDAMGCNRWGNDLNIVVAPGVAEKLLSKKANVLTLRHTPIENSDWVWINYTKEYYTLSKKPKWKPGTVWVLSSCRQAELFVVEEAEAFFENLKNKIWLTDLAVMRLSKLHSVILYVAKTDRKNAKEEPIYALYSTDLNGRTQERVEGVEKIKITQGEKSVKLEFLLTSSLLKQWWVWEF